MSKQKRRSRPNGPLLASALAVGSVVVLLAGCHLFGTSRTVENYFPLAVGNQWCWVRANDPSDSLTMEINGSQAVGGIRFYKLPFLGDSGLANWFVHYDGELRIYTTESDSAPDTASTDYARYLKEPFDVGASWPVESADSSESLRITGNDITLTVPAGTFENCIQVEFYLGTYCYAPGVGWVKLSILADSANSYVLKRYTIK